MSTVEVLREVDGAANVSPEAEIGPYCVIGPGVTIGAGSRLFSRVSVTGDTTLGRDNVVEDGCVLGGLPQDLKFKGEHTRLVIGDRNHLRREVTCHLGTEFGGFLTYIGNDNVLMDRSHVAHDCYLDDHTVIGEMTLLAGHIHVQSGAVIEAMVGVQSFATIGRHAHVGPRTPVRRDVPPFTSFFSRDCDWSPAVRGIHDAGIEAAGLSREEEKELRRALQELFYDESALQTKIEQLVNLGVEGEVAGLCDFCQKSLSGVYGRYRELFRGKMPPGAEHLLTEREKEWFRRDQS
jgi:UDP-N-acetylglucosamine acyltransferase